jgi:hypothetical protein
MADALSLPMAEIAVLLGEGKLKARALAEEAIANHERFGAKSGPRGSASVPLYLSSDTRSVSDHSLIVRTTLEIGRLSPPELFICFRIHSS